jgi:nucleoside triphosphatase
MRDTICSAKWLTIAAFFPDSGRFPVAALNRANALKRRYAEVAEELGEALQLTQITPWTFSDDIRVKTYADGRQEEIYMIYLIFDCLAPTAKSPSTTSFRRMPG